MNSGLKVICPTSVSNLACGFDVLGMALDIPCDEIIGIRSSVPGVRITSITGYKTGISLNPMENTAGIAAMALLRHLNEPSLGFEFKMHKHIPGGSGLGSSAASAVAAVVLVNELLQRPLEKRELIPFAIEGEMLASITPVGDNVVPEMIGGLVLIRDILTYDYHRIYTPPGLYMAILLPAIRISTQEGRKLLGREVLLGDMVKQSANLGAFVIGMNTGDLELVRRSMDDLIIEPQRKHMIPHFDTLKEIAMTLGALGCSISGSGPAIFALCQEKTNAQEIAAAMQRAAEAKGVYARTFVGGINHEGVTLW